MKMKRLAFGLCVVILAAALGVAVCAEKGGFRWGVHDMKRPVPPVVTPGDKPGDPPSDATVLFDGEDTSKFVDTKGGPVKWKVENGYMEVTKGTIRTKDKFGDCQLHIEWASPEEVKGKSQGRGNSGVYLMGRYEVQILDCYKNRTYADGMAGAVYGQHPPLANTCRKPGEWQTYDIIFRRPHFGEDGELLERAVVTVLHNGVAVQDSAEYLGSTVWKKRAKYSPHGDKDVVKLQNHGSPVRFRNIWVRDLPEPTKP